MAGYFVNTFEWDALQKHLAAPTTAEKVAKRIPKKRSGPWARLPKEQPKLVPYVASLFASTDWYAGKSVEEAELVEQLVFSIFNPDLKLRGLDLEAPPDGLYFDPVELARGEFEIDTKRSTKSSTAIRRATKVPPSQEFKLVGRGPFRHAQWNVDEYRISAQENNPFELGAIPLYRPQYSVHSPDSTAILLAEAEAGAARLKAADAKTRESYEEHFLSPLRNAAERDRAVFVTVGT